MIWLDEFEQFIAALKASGLHVERVGPGLAFSLCPLCLDNGRHELLEIRAAPGGEGVELGGCYGGEQ
jgi:hypothetical protein